MHHGFLGDACVARGQVTDLPLYLIRDSVCYEKRALVRQGKGESVPTLRPKSLFCRSDPLLFAGEEVERYLKPLPILELSLHSQG